MKKVHYYSVMPVDGELSYFDRFVQTQQKVDKDKLGHIMRWLSEIGNKYKAVRFHFRNESFFAEAHALPPKGRNKEPVYVEEFLGEEQNTPNNMRLYCIRLNEYVVILLNGAIKTAAKAQDCPNVNPHFTMANSISKHIGIAIQEKLIRWRDDYTDIEFNEDFVLQW